MHKILTYIKIATLLFVLDSSNYSLAQSIDTKAAVASNGNESEGVKSVARVFSGFVDMPPGERLDWASFRLSTAEMGFDWADVVAFQEVDDRIFFIISDNVGSPNQLYAASPSPERVTSIVRFLLGVSHHGKSRQLLKGCSKFEPLIVQSSVVLEQSTTGRK